MKYLQKYKLFLEARIRDLIGNNREFSDDEDFIRLINLKGFNEKPLIIKWNHTPDHDLILYLEKRTSYLSVSEFNVDFEAMINKLFNNYLDLFGEKIIEFSKYRLKFCVKTDYFNVIIKLHYNQIFEDDAEIEVVTIAPKYCNNIDFEININ